MMSPSNPDELLKMLRSRLIECGWRDKIANMTRDIIEKDGIQNVKLEQILNEVRPKARMIVPDDVKTEMLELIRKMQD